MTDVPDGGATSERRSPMRRLLVRLALVAIAGFLLMQLVPYGWVKENPPVRAEAPWPSEAARGLAKAACYDCHSNETEWPLYSYVAPMSWLVRNDVETGRSFLNFSEWGPGADAGEAADSIEDGDMPPRQYALLHPGAQLSPDERALLIAALEQMEDAAEAEADVDGDRSGRGRGRGRGRGGR